MRTIALLLLLAPPLWTQAPQGATLRGHVYAREDGRPLRNVLLTILSSGRIPEWGYAVTDSYGAYEFLDVAPGPYSLSCWKAGYLGANYGNPQFLLAARQERSVNFRLLRSAAISGRVMDEAGEPLTNATIRVSAQMYGQTRRERRVFSETLSGADGRYRLYGLPPGRYWVTASAPGDYGYAPVFFFHSLAPREAEPVEVAAGGEATGIEFQMIPGTAPAKITGRVADQFGQPASKGTVTATITGVPLDIRSVSYLRSNGAFEIRGLAPGRYRLVADTGNRQARRNLNVGADGATTSIRMWGGTTVRGRLIWDGDPKLLRDHYVYMIGLDGTEEFSAPAVIRSDLTFQFDGVQPGSYGLVVKPRRSLVYEIDDTGDPFYIAGLLNDERFLGDDGLVVDEASSVLGVGVVLESDGGTVEGVLRDESGQPLPDASVLLAPADPKLRQSPRHFKLASTNDKGEFAVRGIIPGDYLLFPWPSGSAGNILRPELFARLEKYAVPLTVEKGSRATQDLNVSNEFRQVIDAWVP